MDDAFTAVLTNQNFRIKSTRTFYLIVRVVRSAVKKAEVYQPSNTPKCFCDLMP